MKIFDISVLVGDSIPVWTGDERPSFEELLSTSERGIIQTTSVSMNVHTGTHIDAPRHFLQKGKVADHILLETLIGKCQVVEFPSSIKLITKENLKAAGFEPGKQRLLLKTSNSVLWTEKGEHFFRDYTAMEISAAEFIVESGVILVGIDYLSIAPYANVWDVHKELLSNDVVILEGLDLNNVNPGKYSLYCLPLKLDCKDGLPVRAVLME